MMLASDGAFSPRLLVYSRGPLGSWTVLDPNQARVCRVRPARSHLGRL